MSPYRVCRLIMFVAYRVCRIIGFVAYRVSKVVAYRVCRSAKKRHTEYKDPKFDGRRLLDR